MNLDALQSLGLSTTQSSDSSSSNKSLGQDEFLQLMTTQLNNQDPFEPMDNGEFLGQIAQFGTVNGINGLLESFQSLATNLQSSQALQASNLIGHDVLVNHDEAYLGDSGSVQGAVNLENSSGDLAVNIYDQNGELVQRLELGSQQPGLVAFDWNGETFAGNRAPAGRYQIEVESQSGGSTTNLQPLVSARVNSLTLGGIGKEMQIELENLGQVGFSDVMQIL